MLNLARPKIVMNSMPARGPEPDPDARRNSSPDPAPHMPPAGIAHLSRFSALCAFGLALICGLPADAEEGPISFRTPSGNIHCLIDATGAGGVRCDIAEFIPSFPKRPVHCDLDWGSAFAVGRVGPALPICAGDTVRNPRASVLEYGLELRGAGVTCNSKQSGLTCVNGEGHGFTLSRKKQSVF